MNLKEVEKVILNDSGMRPVEYKCVVRLDPVEEKKGSIYIPDERRSKDQMATTKATLLAVGPIAFTDPDWGDPKPQPGDRVIINKYAGQFKEADPEDRDRIINDREILAILDD